MDDTLIQASRAPADAGLWPPISAACRPWTRWWWLGSAISEAEISRQLELFHEAGIGGVEISPISGVRGEQERAIPFLSPRWVSMLRHTVREARRLGIGVDMICGTGWPLGGPWVSDEHAAACLALQSWTLSQGGQLAQPIICATAPEALLQSLMAFSQDGQALDLIQDVDAERQLRWIAPPGQWRIYALFQRGTGQQVKRAAPGGEGHVLDHFSAAALARYLEAFDRALAVVPPEEQVRCFFNDSYEVYGANWTAAFLAQFQQRRGYDLRRYLPALDGQAAHELVCRVRCDYRQTIAELLLEDFVRPWTAWAHGHGSRTRNQAHGAPGNMLDLYAAADIPETETFGTSWLERAGLSPLPGTSANYGGRADILVCKLASSAAHVAGKALCSSETFTWLGEHGKVPLSHMKAVLDLQFAMGINHVFFHGTPFSPAAADWPGWLFYATTHVGPSNSFWRDLPALNAYISRCQSFLQSGQPDNDLLLYLPIFDLWSSEHHATDLLHFLTPHNTEAWLDSNLAEFTAVGRWLWDQGYSFDCISDDLLAQAIEVAGSALQSRGGSYRAIVVAGCQRMPPETLQRLLELAREGASVLIVGALPQDVPGLSRLDERRAELGRLLATLEPLHELQPGLFEAQIGQSRLLIGAEAQALLEAAGLRRERSVDLGIELIRRREPDGFLYFLANLGREQLDQWVSFPVQAASAMIVDPLSGAHGLARIRAGALGETEVYLQLAPGESLLLRMVSQASEAPGWRYLAPAGPSLPIRGQWHVEFIDGGPRLPGPFVLPELASWTEWPGETEALRALSGTARYRINVEQPAGSADAWWIELGQVCHSARVRLNGQELGTCYAHPFRLALPSALLRAHNELEIEVTNLMANRLADLDRQGLPWQKFFFVNIQYEPFDASQWEPLPSGLLGPVRLVPLRQLDPL